MPLKKKPPGLMGDLKKFMDDSGITDELKAHGADLLKSGIRKASKVLEAELNPAVERPRPEFYFTTAAPTQPTPKPEGPNDPYVVLGVAPTAATADIDAVFKKRMHRQHPDKGGDPEEFMRTTEAWNKIKKLRGVTYTKATVEST